MNLTIEIRRSDGQWVTTVLKAKEVVAWSRSLQRLRARLGISVREVGDIMGVSGTRAQQLLTK